VEFFRNNERVHLRDEKEELFPLFLRHVQPQPAPLRQARIQHVQLEGFARKLGIAVAAGIVDRGTLGAAAELLDAHIRLEERQLFPLIEELVPDDELRRLGLANRDVTCPFGTLWVPEIAIRLVTDRDARRPQSRSRLDHANATRFGISGLCVARTEVRRARQLRRELVLVDQAAE
jgi:hemerythrin HHE cation binding domain-containing protein